LKTFVAEGGCLLASFETSLCDETGNQLRDFQLGDVFGLKYLEKSDVAHGREGVVEFVPQSYFTTNDHEIFEGLPKNVPFPLRGAYIRTEVTSGETIVYQREPAVVNFEGQNVSWPKLPGEETIYPAIHVNQYGKGKAVFITSQFFKQQQRFFPAPFSPHGYSRTGESADLWWGRQLIGNMLRLLDPTPPIRVEAPPTVEATFWNNPAKKQIIVQLLNKTHVDILVPIENIKIRISKDTAQPKEANMPWPSKRALKIREKEDVTEVSIPKIGLHELVILL